jgi:hypothetical protein
MATELAISRDSIDYALVGLSPARGVPLKFDNGSRYRGFEREALDTEQDFLVTDLSEAWVFLKKGCPVEYVVKEPESQVRPSRPTSFTDKTAWAVFNNQPTDPWRYNSITHLLALTNGETFRFASPTAGAWACRTELLTQIKAMRQLQPGSLPIVRAGSTSFKTQFGPRLRPMFRIVGWQRPKMEANESKQIEQERVNPFNDKIDF